MRIEANKSSLKAILLNKVGDFSIIFGAILIYNTVLSTELILINIFTRKYAWETLEIFNGIEINIVNLVGFLILIGAITKSAQLLFSI